MQGTRAAAEVMEALDRLERDAEVDVVVVARGGGSVEDLLPFSDEAVVRAVHRMRTPVVSAIGHEPDQPLLDLVADVRASTPTDAAKLVVPDVAEEVRGVTWARDRIRSVLAQLVTREQAGLDALRSRPALADPASLVGARSEEVAALRDRARRSLGHVLDRAADDIGHQRARARALSPLATLQRGYAVLQDADGAVLTSVAQAAPGDAVAVRLADGRLHATIDRAEDLAVRSDHTADDSADGADDTTEGAPRA
jgi:exodeoxyribonuclease VII large subunit